LHFIAPGGEKVKYFEVVMEEVIISDFTQVALDGIPTESINFNYGRITTTYVQQNRTDGAGGGSVVDGWDRIANKRMA
jgi:type VI secretion system secreted protein Hcp